MKKESFGRTKEGTETWLYTLENSRGMKAAIADYGASLVRLLVPDRFGQVKDVVLGFDTVSGYESNPSFFGALIAPNANRIEGASFVLNGQTFYLKKNNGENNLHSDEKLASHKRIWSAVRGQWEESICLTLKLADGEMGFPGNKEFRVTYSLNEENELRIAYQASSDKDCIINPTNHSYFNLKGHGEGTIEDHSISLRASAYTPADEASIPTGELALVEGTPMDLRGEITVADRIDEEFQQLKFAGGFDHNWATDHYSGNLRRIAVVKAPAVIRTLEVYTDLPGVQFYSGNFIDDQIGKENLSYGKRSGLCLETQFYPDSIHKPNFPSVVFGPNRKYESVTIYKFI